MVPQYYIYQAASGDQLSPGARENLNGEIGEALSGQNPNYPITDLSKDEQHDEMIFSDENN